MFNNHLLSLSDIKAQVPLEWEYMDLEEGIRAIQHARNRKIIVLDDDPTGVQTVHDINVLTKWDKDLLREAFDEPDLLFYILTNTRGYREDDAARINREIVQNVHAISVETGIDFVLISRSDSTLRGHYPLEVDVLSEQMTHLTGKDYDAHILIPAFFEGGRITYQNTHCIVENDRLIPAHETEFANDKVFGYLHGDLTEWVAEKTGNRFQPDDCLVVPLTEIRRGPDGVEKALCEASGNVPVIINCLSYADLNVVSLALLRLETQGKRFIYRTAASFVKSYGGITNRDHVPADMLVAKGSESNGGLVVVGSYVQKTTRQLNELIHSTDIVPLEMDVERILKSSDRDEELRRLTLQVNDCLRSGRDVVVYSSRTLVADADIQTNMKISHTVSMALVHIVQTLQVIPKFIIAKGGITSSDVATEGLGVRRARVLGQASAGIPVWLTGDEAKFSRIPYIVFPGNVGTDETLAHMVERLKR